MLFGLGSWALTGIAGAGIAGAVTVTALVVTTSGPFASDMQQLDTPTVVADVAELPTTVTVTTEATVGAIELSGVAWSSRGYVVTDFAGRRVSLIEPGRAASAIAGTGAEAVTDGGAFDAAFYTPQPLIVGKDGTVYVADSAAHRIRVVSTSGAVSTLAGGGDVGLGQGSLRDGIGGEARFNLVAGIAWHPSGDIIVADKDNNAIRRVTLGGVVTTIAGNGEHGDLDGPAMEARFSAPVGVAVESDGTIWVTEHGNNAIRVIEPDSTVRTVLKTVPGLFQPGAALTYPSGIAIFGKGIAIVADTQGQRIFAIDKSGKVGAIAGSGSVGDADGVGPAASFSRPSWIVALGSGEFVVADAGNSRLRRLSFK